MTNTKKSWKIFWLGDWLVLNHLPGSVLFPWIWSEASGLENMTTVIHTKIIFDCKLTLLGSLKNNICLVMQFLFWFKKTCCFFCLSGHQLSLTLDCEHLHATWLGLFIDTALPSYQTSPNFIITLFAWPTWCNPFNLQLSEVLRREKSSTSTWFHT